MSLTNILFTSSTVVPQTVACPKCYTYRRKDLPKKDPLKKLNNSGKTLGMQFKFSKASQHQKYMGSLLIQAHEPRNALYGGRIVNAKKYH